MRDYTKIPGYENLTPLDARFRYMHDLLREYQGLSGTKYGPCTKIPQTDGCRYCSFSGHLGGDLNVPCCWRAEDKPDAAIHILEKLLGKEVNDAEPELPLVQKIQQIANYYGIDNQVSIAQEELAELIQALSKWRRAESRTSVAAYDMVLEEFADVTLMLKQIQHLFHIDPDDVTAVVKEKVERQLRRIAEESEE